MTFIPAICPSCGGSLQVPDNRDQVRCMYCGGDVIVRQAIHLASGTNLKNLMELAEAAVASANYKEAFEYYTKVLELDPSNATAWAGKGESAGWMSTLNDIKTTEMIVGLNNAIKHTPESEKESMRKQAAEAVNRVTTACYSMARKHVVEFVAVDNVWVDYLSQCQLILPALEAGHSYDPTNKFTIENIIEICADNIRGLLFSDFEGNSKAVFLSNDYDSTLRQKMDEYVLKMQQLDPSFKAQKVKTVSVSNCFIVTATMGNENQRMVRDLREFRDTWLIRWSVGRFLAKGYDLYGPVVAAVVARSVVLRRLSLVLFVWPLRLAAQLILKFSHRRIEIE
jgi:hypothetical protein